MFSSSGSQIDSGAGGCSSSQTTDSSLSSAKVLNFGRDAQPMVPVTVKQISDAVPSTHDKSSFLIDGFDVKHVMLVGMSFNKSERVTDVSFFIDDGTGRIGCHRWVNDTVDTTEVGELSDGTYVRVHGLLKGFQGKKQLQVFAIRPVINYDEISSPFLPAYISIPLKLDISTLRTGIKTTLQTNMGGLKGIDKMVIEYLEQPSSVAQEKGVHRNEIAQHLKIPLDKILETIESLDSKGLVYSTIDECHYKSTSSG